MSTYLETPRLILRQFTADDLDSLVSLDADPAVMHFITAGVPTSRDELASDYIPAYLAYYERGNRAGFSVAEEKDTGRFLAESVPVFLKCKRFGT